MTDRKTPIEYVFDIETDNQIWNPIVGFRGYEVSNKGYVRSLKFYKEYPYGILLSPDKKNNYVLTDNNNVRRKINITNIFKMRDTTITTFTNSYCNGYFHSRNERHFINYETVYYESYLEQVERVPRPVNKDQLFLPKFTIIDEDKKKVINPLTFHNLFNL